jgi:hypothetical protein
MCERSLCGREAGVCQGDVNCAISVFVCEECVCVCVCS